MAFSSGRLLRLPVELDRCDDQYDACRVLWRRIQRNVRWAHDYDRALLTSSNSLPDQVQSAVCNSGLKIADWLYPVYWDNGAWSVQRLYPCCSSLTTLRVFTGFSTPGHSLASRRYLTDKCSTNFKNQAILNQTSSNNNTFTQCKATSIANSTTSLSTSTSTPSVTTSSTGTPSATDVSGAAKVGSSNTGAIVGGIVGGLGGLALILLAALCFLRRRRAAAVASVAAGGGGDVPLMSSVAPSMTTTPDAHGIVPYDVPQAYSRCRTPLRTTLG